MQIIILLIKYYTSTALLYPETRIIITENRFYERKLIKWHEMKVIIPNLF